MLSMPGITNPLGHLLKHGEHGRRLCLTWHAAILMCQCMSEHSLAAGLQSPAFTANKTQKARRFDRLG